MIQHVRKLHRSAFLVGAFAVLLPGTATSSTATLAVSSLTGAADGGTVQLSIRLGGLTRPAALRWDLNYSPLDFSTVNLTPGPAVTDAGKTLSCVSRAAGSIVCVVAGMNANVMQDGVVATVSLALSLNPVSGRTLGISNGQASTQAGVPIAVSATSGAVTADRPGISSLSCAPASVTGMGAKASCTMRLTRPAGAAGATAAVSDSHWYVSVPGTVAIPAGASTATFAATVSQVPTVDVSVTVTARLNNVSAASTLQVNMLAVSSLSCSPSQLPTGATASCTVKLNRVAPTSTVVKIVSGTALLTVPAEVTVPAGSAAAPQFQIKAGTVTSELSTVVRATLVQTVSTPVILIRSVTCPCTIWTSSNAPALASDPKTTVAVEVGMKFRSVSAGYVLGLRFFKGAANTGTHTGRLWTRGGTLLASAQFTNETALGWQQVNFPAPVAIAANTTYVVTYQAPNGRMANDANYFAASGVTRGPLTALKEGVDGSNGVLRFGNGFPASGAQSRNHWVDVVFNAAASSSATSVPIPSTSTGTATKSISRPSSGGLISAIDPVTGNGPESLSCSPKRVKAGGSVTCQLTIPEAAEALTIAIGSDQPAVRLPREVRFRAGQRQARFVAAVEQEAFEPAAVISAEVLGTVVRQAIEIEPSEVAITAPGEVLARTGEGVNFTPTARDRAGYSVTVSASKAPKGASMGGDGGFEWIPQPDQDGAHDIEFTATSPSGASATWLTRIVTGSQPFVSTQPDELACSPGAIGVLEGRWLSTGREQWTGPAGTAQRVEGAGVRISGEMAPLLSFHPARAEFLCPQLPAGSRLRIEVETPSGSTAPVETEMAEASPRILQVRHLGTSREVVPRDHRDLGEPAQPGDVISLRVTGTGSTVTDLEVTAGGERASVLGAAPSPDEAGISYIDVRLPGSINPGDSIPLQVSLVSPSGRRFTSKTATMAIEPSN